MITDNADNTGVFFNLSTARLTTVRSSAILGSNATEEDTAESAQSLDYMPHSRYNLDNVDPRGNIRAE
jgi:hypothetical protein